MAPSNKQATDQKHERKNHIIIEVCQGPDCKTGGGPALLEIEELVKEVMPCTSRCSLVVVEGGCREYCAVGPNVHIRKKDEIINSFNGVKDVSICNSVVESAVMAERGIFHSNEKNGSPLKNTTISSTSAMMTRRAERMRWEALKHASRSIAKCRKEISNLELSATSSESQITKMRKKIDLWKQSCDEELESMQKVDTSASSIALNRERARRRAHRLKRIIYDKFDRCLHFEDDESSDDESCGDSSNDESYNQSNV